MSGAEDARCVGTSEDSRTATGSADSDTATGIGLSVVRHVVEAHDGILRVDSKPGEGTTVTIELPIAS